MVHDHIILPFQMHFYLAPAVFGLTFVKDFFDQQVIGVILIWFALLAYPAVVPAARNTGEDAAKPDILMQGLNDPVFLARP